MPAVKKTKAVIPLTDRVIPGITWKVIITVITATAAVVIMYFSIISKINNGSGQSKLNFDLLTEMKADKKQEEIDKKESDRILNIRLADIELNQRETKIRLTNLETRIPK
jgi:hypothetical protein